METDSKPVLGLLQKQITTSLRTPLKFQRMLFELFKCRFKFIHVPIKKLCTADVFSRSPTNMCSNTSFLGDGVAVVHTNLSATKEHTMKCKMLSK